MMDLYQSQRAMRQMRKAALQKGVIAIAPVERGCAPFQKKGRFANRPVQQVVTCTCHVQKRRLQTHLLFQPTPDMI